MKSLVELQGKLKGRRAIVAIGADVTLHNGAMVTQDDWRLWQALPTLQFLLREGANVVILNKIGRPEGVDPTLSNKVLIEPLEQHLRLPVHFVPFGETVPRDPSKRVVLMDNIRFDAREEDEHEDFAKELAANGDLYVFDAFNYAHRNHTSVWGISRLLPTYPGLLVEKETKILLKTLEDPEQPLGVIIGGIKVETKALVLKNFLSVAKYICLGGVLANSILHKQGKNVGTSIIDKEAIDALHGVNLTSPTLQLPIDTIVNTDADSEEGAHEAVLGEIQSGDIILDIGPKTIHLFKELIKDCNTIIWNGPMGKNEMPAYACGTIEIAKAISESAAFSILGGGDTISFLQANGIAQGFNHLSTGGGAMLELLAQRTLPAIQAIEQSQKKYGIL